MAFGPILDLHHKTPQYEKPSLLSEDPLFRNLQFCPPYQAKHHRASIALSATCTDKTPEFVSNYYSGANCQEAHLSCYC